MYMSLAIVYCPTEVQDLPMVLSNEDSYLLVFTREQFDKIVENDNLREDTVFVNDPREA